MWKAFEEMEQLGWIGSERPRMVVVQADGCAPIVRAFEQGATFAPMFPNARTAASGLRVPAAVGDFLMLDILRKSGGTAITISDDELMQGVYELARLQGVHAARVERSGEQQCTCVTQAGSAPTRRSCCLIPGAAVKYNHLPRCDDALRLDHTDPDSLNQLEQSLTASGFVQR